MVRAKATGSVERQGVAIAMAAFESIGFAFREQDVNDFGIDAHAELLEAETATGRLLAMQLKSGNSYLEERANGGYVYRSDRDHVEYWLKHCLPVLVCLCDVDQRVVFWERLAAETVASTGKGCKIVVPDEQRVDMGSRATLRDACTRVISASRYTELRTEDVSHGGAKRYSFEVVVNGSATKSEIAAIVRQVTSEGVKRRYYRSHLVEGRWGDADADVVWVFVYPSADDRRQSNWVCRSWWINERLSESMRPLTFSGENIGGGVTLEWREGYEAMASFAAEHTLLKEDYLSHALEVASEVEGLLSRVSEALARLECGELGERAFIDETADARGRVREIYMEWSDFGLAPFECAEVDKKIDEFLALADNVALFYSPEGCSKWSSSSRLKQALDNCREAVKVVPFIEYEADKIR
jgi:hypothetical protein